MSAVLEGMCALLGNIQGLVGFRDQVEQFLVAFRTALGIANGKDHPHVVFFLPEFIAVRSIVLLRRFMGQHQEFIAAVTVIMPVGIQVLQLFADFPQDRVTRGMPALVIDLFEIVSRTAFDDTLI